MKKLFLPLFALLAYTSKAQLSIVPQLGMEGARTTISSGNFSSFAPLHMQFSPRLAVRVAYNLKSSGHGAYVGVATSSPSVDFSFTDPQAAQTSYTASAKDLQLRLEAGYQFTSKPITLRKAAAPPPPHFGGRYAHRFSGAQQHGCLGRSGCGMRTSSASSYAQSSSKTSSKDQGLYMRIKPSLGVALAPSQSEIETETKGGQTTYEYSAGLKTAIVAGTAFEFGTRTQAKFVVSINYLRSLGNNTQTLITGANVKAVSTSFSSKTSGFNVSLGMPIRLGKKPVVVQHPRCIRSSYYHSRCGQFKM